RRAGVQTIWLGVLIGALALGLGCWYFFTGRPEWQTMIFTSLAFMQVFQALASRSGKESLFKIGVLSNPWLAGLAFLVIVLQMMVMYLPALAKFFDVLPLSGCDLSIAAATGVIVFVVMEMEKKFKS
ncbi:MAG: cation transporting ATPase C-terminal domain-containing protein, partial [Armatimonadota bacterium]